MAEAASDEKNAITMLFEFFCSPSKPLVIDGVDKLSIDDQLEILKKENICSQKKRKETVISLHDKLPDLKDHAHKRIRFKSLLSSYYKSYIELETTTPSKWTKKQLPLALFVYLIQQLQKTPDDDKEKEALAKEKKASPSSFKFVYYTLKYCNEEIFDGEQLYKFYMEVTNNGVKTGGFGLKFVQKICGQYKLKFGKFAKVKKKVGVWYTDNVNRSNKPPPPQDDKKEDNAQKTGTSSTSTASTASTATTATTATGTQKQEAIREAGPSGSKWYWMDMEEFQWTPYRDDDQEILNQAYANKLDRCNVVNGKYRVEFDPEGAAAGNQFQNNIPDPINHMVVRGVAEDGTIHGMTCADKPK